jgi:Lon protease-like protein
MSDAQGLPQGFRGTARLFPLPNLVLFPSVIQPLHIFEPRYRQMMADALEDDRLLALVLLRPGWEEDYHLRPPVHEVACLGRITNEQRLADGRYNLLLHGLGRVRILEEAAEDRPYRVARVELLRDQNAAEKDELRRELDRRALAWFGKHGSLEQVRELLQSDLPLAVIGDIFSFILPLEVEFKQELLEELDVAERIRRLVAHMDKQQSAAPSSHPFLSSSSEGGKGPVERKFPPEFSLN